MAVSIVRPERNIVSIPSEDSRPCVECGNCRIGRDGTTGACHNPDNKQDSKGVIPEIIADIFATEGHCSGFIFRRTRRPAVA